MQTERSPKMNREILLAIVIGFTLALGAVAVGARIAQHILYTKSVTR